MKHYLVRNSEVYGSGYTLFRSPIAPIFAQDIKVWEMSRDVSSWSARCLPSEAINVLRPDLVLLPGGGPVEIRERCCEVCYAEHPIALNLICSVCWNDDRCRLQKERDDLLKVAGRILDNYDNLNPVDEKSLRAAVTVCKMGG